MCELTSCETVVVGVGNSILSDDGVGIHAVRLLERDPRLPANVDVLDGGTLGLELLPYISDSSRILFLDAVNTGAAPGTPIRMTAEEVLGIKTGVSVHQLGVSDLISALALTAIHPQEIILLGVQPANTDWGTELSPGVGAALPGLIDAAVAQLALWQTCPRPAPIAFESRAATSSGHSQQSVPAEAFNEGSL
jgi:hydrogenase maturation protease